MMWIGDTCYLDRPNEYLGECQTGHFIWPDGHKAWLVDGKMIRYEYPKDSITSNKYLVIV